MGEQFIGPYRLLSVLGHGPVTTVYKAWQESLDRPVTLKVVTRPDASALCRLQGEMQLTATLADPHIRQVYEAGQTPDGQVYVALQFVDCSLKEVMRQRFATRAHKPFSREEIAKLLAPIASALDNLHKHGMVHLDIKPENILVFKDMNRTVLADLGIVQAQGARTRAGTPLYASPEQAAGNRPIGPWCDIYSLGVVVYEMLTGRTPFRGSVDLALLRLHLEEAPPPPRQFRPDIPADLERAVLQALSKDPRQRFSSASAFVEAVRRTPTPIAEMFRHTTVILRSTPQMVKRRPWMLGAAALVVALPLMVVTVFGFMRVAPTATPTTMPTLVVTSTTTPLPAIVLPTETPPLSPSATLRSTSTATPTRRPPTRTPTPAQTGAP